MTDVLDDARQFVAVNYGRTSNILRFARALLAAEKVVEAVREFEHEMANPVPDALYRKTLRDRIFKLRAAYDAATK